MTRLKEARELRGYTQLQIANAIGLSRSAYTNIEIGRVHLSADTLCAIANFLNVSADYILQRTDVPADIRTNMSDEELRLIDVYRFSNAEWKKYMLQSADLAEMKTISEKEIQQLEETVS